MDFLLRLTQRGTMMCFCKAKRRSSDGVAVHPDLPKEMPRSDWENVLQDVATSIRHPYGRTDLRALVVHDRHCFC